MSERRQGASGPHARIGHWVRLIGTEAQSLLHHARAEIFAQTCPGCSGVLPVHMLRGFCATCLSLLELETAPLQRRALLQYGGPLQEAVRGWKYHGRFEHGPVLEELFCVRLVHTWQRHPNALAVDVVIPVPMHKAKLRARGFNPAALLAQSAARIMRVPCDTQTLRCVRPTLVQAGLGRADRMRNVSGAFAAAKSPSHATRALLVDDVYTTGATMRTAAQALRDAGYQVTVLALARAEPIGG